MSDSGDAYRPAEIAAMIEGAGIVKARLPAGQMLMLAVLAGAFIGFGAAAWLMTMSGADMGSGPVRILGGMVFSLGLILVVVGGAELFTGNALMVMAAVDRRISLASLMRNWMLVYAGNLVGAAGLALAFALSGHAGGVMGETAGTVVAAKLALSPLEAFVRAALCNALVCLAVWLSFAARNATDKILGVLWPVTAFVALGLEHSVANMFLLPFAALAGAPVAPADAITNLAIVTAGNVLGGAGGVAVAYRYAYLARRPD